MIPPNRRLLAIAITAGLCAIAPAVRAQHGGVGALPAPGHGAKDHGAPAVHGGHAGHGGGHGNHGAAPAGPVTGPFGLAVFGGFMRMVQTQDFGPKVQLRAVMQAGATEAVGAAAGLRAEITVIDGKLLVTYGAPCPSCGAPGEDHATLLASAKVDAWHAPVSLPADLTGTALDDFIVARAQEAGLDTTKPFPMRMKGTLTAVKMHIIASANPRFKGHGSGHPMAEQQEIAAERIDGEVVGFYAPPTAQGIITHPGEPFHYHWVDTDRTRTAHLDAFGMAKGAQLLLPQR